ncbi:MAG: phage tail protein [Chloroflexota bacterium]|nr:phage tail protein [Chloroflexota bacterium]
MTAPLLVDHVADAYRRYPGEPLVFYTRVTATRETAAHYSLEVTLPVGVTLERNVTPHQAAIPQIVRWATGEQTLNWNQVPAPLETHEYEVHTSVLPTNEDGALVSQATLTSARGTELGSEAVSVVVAAHGRYLRHLPALYERDDFMGRFLMLFESFWGPIEGQIDKLPYYFDPRTAPPGLLPWLASWLDLVLNERWPEAKRRRLLQAAVSLYRRRGTREGLADYLEIYTDVRPEIVEHRAENFVLGPQACLGQGVALGTRNRPHTFTVRLELPPMMATAAQERKQMIEQIVAAEKPVHTAYRLDIRVVAAK